MPKATFFRLPDEKRNRLLDAARTEFGRTPFVKASVSNIIELAGIPRGSFYQYFEDKQDIFYYMLEVEGGSAVEHLKRNSLRIKVIFLPLCITSLSGCSIQ
ncbi:TetR/AcrR family transcriptional regulator [Lacticaseibacillus hulanensis]|uniref:TetR/AcrR family transcriptional regulator n=1 Tax=Lacticaseibacillus hulanensis TaxID=2493111 RepID=UPI000FDC523C|nr:TetR/AcrR family transcriptional regulator [Lacticaseibacillus hulanensis]